MKLNREDIHLLSRYSNWEKRGVEKMLKESVYSSKSSWQQFLKVFLITLGIGFTVSGIIFFFAYNWADLHKFAKIGLMQSLIVIATLVVVFSKMRLLYRNILLTGTSMLVGVLFAVFGQVYQTGANAYDFFLAWTIFITVWVIVAGFAPLWLLFVILVNTTLILYADQVAYAWPDQLLTTLLFVLNAATLVGFILLKKSKKVIVPDWFTNILVLTVVVLSTTGVCIGIFKGDMYFWLILLLTIIVYGAGVFKGFSERNLYYLAIIALSLIVIIAVLLIRFSEDELMFLLVCGFIIGSVTLLIKTLIDLHKKWQHEIKR